MMIKREHGSLATDGAEDGSVDDEGGRPQLFDPAADEGGDEILLLRQRGQRMRRSGLRRQLHGWSELEARTLAALQRPPRCHLTWPSYQLGRCLLVRESRLLPPPNRTLMTGPPRRPVLAHPDEVVECPACGDLISGELLNACVAVASPAMSSLNHAGTRHLDRHCAPPPTPASSRPSSALAPIFSRPSAASSSSSGSKRRPASPPPPHPSTSTQSGSTSAKRQKTSTQAVQDAKPLAERLRPTTLEDFQGEAFAPGSMLRTMVDEGSMGSCILWGPPGRYASCYVPPPSTTRG